MRMVGDDSVPWIIPTSLGRQVTGPSIIVAANPSPDAARDRGDGGPDGGGSSGSSDLSFRPAANRQNIGPEGGSGSFKVAGPNGCTWTPRPPTTGSRLRTAAAGTGMGRSITPLLQITPAAATARSESAAGLSRFPVGAHVPLSTFCVAGFPRRRRWLRHGDRDETNSCDWTATSNAPWISIIAGGSDSGNGTVSFTVQPNTGAARNGILTIAGLRYTVTKHRPSAITPFPRQAIVFCGGRSGNRQNFNESVCTVEHKRRARLGHRHTGEWHGNTDNQFHGRRQPGYCPQRWHHHRGPELCRHSGGRVQLFVGPHQS